MILRFPVLEFPKISFLMESQQESGVLAHRENVGNSLVTQWIEGYVHRTESPICAYYLSLCPAAPAYVVFLLSSACHCGENKTVACLNDMF